jgi:hypothetical protein
MNIKRKNIFTGEVSSRDIAVDPNDMMLYRLEMGSIDELMPYLTDGDKEFILFGVSDGDWSQKLKETYKIVENVR